jgi:hypothetical protein
MMTDVNKNAKADQFKKKQSFVLQQSFLFETHADARHVSHQIHSTDLVANHHIIINTLSTTSSMERNIIVHWLRFLQGFTRFPAR